MQKYYLEDEYNTKHQDACTCLQKYGKCYCEKPRKRKSSKRKNADKPLFLQKQEIVYLTPQKPNEGGCGSCGTNVIRSTYDQRGCHSTPPPVLQPLTATPLLIAQQTSPLPPRGKDLPYYKEDVPTKECACAVDKQPPKMYLKQSSYSTGQAQHTKQAQHIMRLDGQAEVCRTRRDSPVQTKDPKVSQQRESLNAQFPCPCMSVNMNGYKKADLWDLQFYKWWGWNWLKEREDILRKQMEKEGKRFSEEFPILMASYYAKEAARGNEVQPQTHTQQNRNSQQLHQSQQRPANQTDRHSEPQRLQPHHKQECHQPERNFQACRQPQPFYEQECHPQQRNQYPQQSCHPQQECYRHPTNQEPQGTQQCRPQEIYHQPQQCQPQQQMIEVHGDCCNGPIEGVYSVSRYPELKQEKKWSFIRTINNAFKSMCKDKRPSDETGVCQCGANLNICGPYNKPCRGLEGIIMPCGFECECGPDRKCLLYLLRSFLASCLKLNNYLNFTHCYEQLPYLQDLCPCGNTCRCPRQHQAAPPPQCQSVPAPAPEITCELPMPARNNVVEDNCGCAAYAKQAQSSSSVSTGTLSHGAQKDHDLNCCCSCDEEMCPCCCCCCLDICQKTVQTSRFCLRENCTQTETIPKKCCRCCRCCSSKGKKQCSMCMKSSDKNLNNDNNNGGNNGRGVYLFKTAQDPASRSYYSTQDRIYLRPNSTSTGACNRQQNYQTGGQYYCQRNSNGQRVTHEIPTNNVKTRAKTTIVKSNSVQCIPPKENKSTSCTYDDIITSETRFDHFMSQLYGTRLGPNKQLFTNPSGADFIRERRRTPVTLDAGDINRLTKAKLRNYFLEGDVYSSPVSGRNYDLSYRAIAAPSKVTDTKLLKPLDINDELQLAQLPSQWFSSDHEHTKLMTAVCEAVLCSNQDSVEVEEPTKESKAKDVEESVELVQEKAEVLQTIKEDSESLRSNTNDVKTVRSPTADLNQNIIFEIQQNFKEKIEKLENKIDKLMIAESNEVEQTNTKRIAMESTRSRSTSPKSQQKKIMEHKPLITKTGLFGVIPTRSQMFNKGLPRRTQEVSHQKGDAKPEEDQKHVDESISKYENLVLTNQKRVNELLVQLETLHSCNTLLDKSGIAEVVQPPICCFEAKEELIYKPNLGTSENNAQEPFQISSDNLFGQLEIMLTGNAQGEKVFQMDKDQINNDSNLRPSTSSARETGIVADTDCLQHEQRIHLDFSSIVFKKYTTTEEDYRDPDVKECEVEEHFPIGAVSNQNFIVRNLPSFTTSITDSFAVEKILRRGDTATTKTASISSKADSFDGSLLEPSSSNVNSEVNLKNKE